MSIRIGIDVGGSTTKIVGFNKGELLSPLIVKSSDPVASVYGAFGKFIADNGIKLSDVERIMVTGVGAAYITSDIYGIETISVSEFQSGAEGGLYLTECDKAIIVSLGTGTSLVYAERNGVSEYLGGTGVGGGTLMGLSRKMLGLNDISHIVEVAKSGNLENIDLRIKDISKKEIGPTLSADITASNFGKMSDTATTEDIALGIINMIFETAAMLAMFAAREKGCSDIILIGQLSDFPQAKVLFENFEKTFPVKFIIPENASHATAIGAALIKTEE